MTSTSKRGIEWPTTCQVDQNQLIILSCAVAAGLNEEYQQARHWVANHLPG
jgi:hypothetical protein